jgi:hypothetical protein
MNKSWLTTTGPDAAHNGLDPVSKTSGVKLTNANANTDTTVTVVPGAQYAITALSIGAFYLGVADTQTAANVMWAVGQNNTIVIEIPADETTLHYATDVAAGVAYMRKIRSE